MDSEPSSLTDFSHLRGWVQWNAVDRAERRCERSNDDVSRRIVASVRRAAKAFPEEPLPQPDPGYGDHSDLYAAVAHEDVARVRELVEAGDRVAWEPAPSDESPLHHAAMTGRDDILKLLLDAGGRDFVNSFSGLQETPLTAAARTRSWLSCSRLARTPTSLDGYK